MRKALFLLLGIILSTACGISEGEQTAPITLDLSDLQTKEGILERVSKITLKVTAEDLPGVKAILEPPFSDTIEFQLDVPIGTNRNFDLTVSLSGSTRTGFRAGATSDVTAEGATVPIDLRFVNFITDATVDQLGSGPDIASVGFAIETQETSSVLDDVVRLKINFENAVDQSQLVAFVEFDADDNVATGRSQTLIDQLSGSIETSFSKGSEFYIVVERSGDSYTPSLYNADNAAVSVAADAKFTAALSSSRTLEISLMATSFGSLIDSNGRGAFNLLVGEKTSQSSLQPPNFSTFSPSDVALGNETVGSAIYDAYFDTTLL